jgi:hypothetical protein
MTDTYKNIIIFENTEFVFNESEYKSLHHEKDDEMLNIIDKYKNDHQFYISKLYSTMVDIYHDFLNVSKRCEFLVNCNDLLKQQMLEIKFSQKINEEEFDEDLFSS